VLIVPHTASLRRLQDAALDCQRCDLYRHATQTVFGEGPSHAAVVAVGEQPGDYEDRQGRPFVGPAGRILARALEASGIDEKQVYITNAVKHFKFEPRGKRRIHKKPDATEIRACRPWLEAEISLVKPRLILALGATAAQTIFEKKIAIGENRGQLLDHPWAKVLVTIHPSAVWRVPEADREREYAGFLEDLKVAGRWLHNSS
jgi:uracil-DNA glycosylase